MKEVALRPYIPANGTEGAYFFEAWCSHCQRDAAMNSGKDFDACRPHEICPIIALSFCEQPKEWVQDAEGRATCNAYIPYTDGDMRESWQKALDEISGVRT